MAYEQALLFKNLGRVARSDMRAALEKRCECVLSQLASLGTRNGESLLAGYGCYGEYYSLEGAFKVGSD